MMTLRRWLIFVLVILAAAGCGGDKNDAPTATPLPMTPPTATLTPIPLTPTPMPTMPPTWTPKPTLSPIPRETVDYSYERPAATDFIPPTYTASPVPPTETPPGPVLIITADMINQAVSAELQAGSGGMYAAPPNIGFQSGRMLISINVLTTPGDLTTARAMTVEARLTADGGRVNVVLERAYFPDTNATYDSELIGNLLTTVQQKVSGLVVQLYGGGTDARFSVADILIADTGITVQTVTIP